MMRNFTYNGVKIVSICTALPAQKKGDDNELKAIAVFEQTTSDLGFLAAQKIIESAKIETKEIGALIFLSKTPDYRGPATAMVLQNRLQIPQDCIVYDAPTGNAGFENAINLVAALLESLPQKYALAVFGDTVSKQLSERDTLISNYQDGTTALLIQKAQSVLPISIAIITLSKYWNAFMVPSGGFRNSSLIFEKLPSKRVGQLAEHLHVDAARIFEAIKPELLIIKEKVIHLFKQIENPNSLVLINLLNPEIERELKSLLSSEILMKNLYISSEICPQTMAATSPLMLTMIFKEKKQLPLCHVVSVSLGEGLTINLASIEIQESVVSESICSNEFYDNGFVTHEM